MLKTQFELVSQADTLLSDLSPKLSDWDALKQELSKKNDVKALASWRPAYYPVHGMVQAVLYACQPGYHVTESGKVKTYVRVMWLKTRGLSPVSHLAGIRQFDTPTSKFYNRKSEGDIDDVHRILLEHGPMTPDTNATGEYGLTDSGKILVGYSQMLVMVARALAFRAHVGQTRKDGRTPYVEHLKAVASTILTQYPFEPELAAAAWLHDVLEDTTMTAKDLADAGIPKSVIETVQELSHRPGETYWDYIIRLTNGKIAKRIKIADITHNMSDAPSPSKYMMYAKALTYLRLRP